MKNIYTLLYFFFLLMEVVSAQDMYEKNNFADVQEYIFNLTLSDDADEIFGEATIVVKFQDGDEKFALDLVSKEEVYGMQVSDVHVGVFRANFVHVGNKLIIDNSSTSHRIDTIRIKYHGIPERGLVIDTTKFGQRSFFGDNWPNLARNWLPCIDHPYDKASVTFHITAPAHYDVVATGKKIEESYLGNDLKLTSYKEPVPVAMKVVTIGVTKFASKLLGMVGDIPVTAWVYPENRIEGFFDYQVAVDVLDYYVQKIGPYPFAKLANMQAKTQWGGLENAGTIAYSENSVTGNNQAEGLIAHEIAHQWFGNSATEDDWNHVWLSEGFATYFTILYQENKYGNEKRKEELNLDRNQIIDYYKRNPRPIVDLTNIDVRRVLSVNSYQKGGWVLNMLRHLVGDDVFWKGIRKYYDQYKNENALTEDFRKIMEDVSGMDLDTFFHQWIYIPGFPELKLGWHYEKGKLQVDVNQLQDHHVFKFPLELGIIKDNQMQLIKVEIDDRSNTFFIPLKESPDYVLFDPEVWLLFSER